jgi:hypothetical protein
VATVNSAVQIVASATVPGSSSLSLESNITVESRNNVPINNTVINTYQIFGQFEVPASTVGWDIQFGAVLVEGSPTVVATAIGCQIFATPLVLVVNP